MSHALLSAALNALGSVPLEAFTPTLLSTSPKAQVWRLVNSECDWVLKCTLDPANEDRQAWDNQAWIHAQAADAHIAPPLIHYQPGHPAILMAHIDAPDWSERINDPALDPELAQTLKILHALPTAAHPGSAPLDWVETIQSYLHHPNVASHPLAATLLDNLKPWLPKRSARAPVLVHHDPHAKNWLADQRPLLIDWEYAGLNDPLFDLVATARYHDWPVGRCEAWLQSYGFAGDWEEFLRLSLWFDAIHWLWCIQFDRFETMPPPFEAKILRRLSSASLHFE